ncbi:CAZyme family GH43 [Paecilomyces variotii]|nr:CAZyme family GH43 [Paecilomyces variotii]KAJ9200267.1 CAZyme family GH43 [Paecilomyces variotii]KAJ9281797.1 CAZyme family GH43 [Paecilomyces variotii]KAJ9347257.1 CAZyme family GH43 [Paecilomyces variotii]KAJ9388728.1 CAZyme family GH43 [Paecilomyces variotii]
MNRLTVARMRRNRMFPLRFGSSEWLRLRPSKAHLIDHTSLTSPAVFKRVLALVFTGYRLYPMVLFAFLALGLIFTFHSARAESPVQYIGTFPDTDEYPLPIQGNLEAHDPNIIVYDNAYYAFHGGIGVPYFRATSLSGPWESRGKVLKEPSIIKKGARKRPWAPSVIEKNGTFYCYYAVTKGGTRQSAIGVATTTNIDDGPWEDHGAVVSTGSSGLNYDVFPYTVSNAIDPAVMQDPADGKFWFTWGSYWTNIWQVALTDDLLSVENPKSPDARNVAYVTLDGRDNVMLKQYPVDYDPQGIRPVEGSFMSYRAPYYYLWFSHGKCCHFPEGRVLPPGGDEYSIRVGRATNITGPYVDKDGRKLTENGGTIVYGSNHGDVYAPGGLGVLTAIGTDQDILYYHYLNKSIGLAHKDAHLGWNYLAYEDGWPVAKSSSNTSTDPSEDGDDSSDDKGKHNAGSGRESLIPLPWCIVSLFLLFYIYL